MVDIMDKIQSLMEIGLSPKEKMGSINVSEAFFAWDILVFKLDIMESIQIIENFISDQDLKLITGRVVDTIQAGIVNMENIMYDYSLPFPTRPPAGSNTTIDPEYYTDRDIFMSLFESIQSFFPILSASFMQSTTPKVRKVFKNHLLLVMEIHEVLVEYGKLKGYLNVPPIYCTKD